MRHLSQSAQEMPPKAVGERQIVTSYAKASTAKATVGEVQAVVFGAVQPALGLARLACFLAIGAFVLSVGVAILVLTR